jgi:hypothetical protein
MEYYCLFCGEKLQSNHAIKDKGGDWYHYRIVKIGKPEVTKCGPVDCFDSNEVQNRKDEMDESEVDV